jgi:dsRNA-specific ribonuclease
VINGEKRGIGIGKSKKEAKQKAARVALVKL